MAAKPTYAELEQRVQAFEKAEADRKRAERAFLIEYKLLETVTQNIGVGLAVISRDFKTIWTNRAIHDIFGDSKDKTCHRLFNQSGNVCPGCGVQEVFSRGKDLVTHEQTGRDAQGNTIWSRIIATPIRDKDGRISSALEVILPITEQKQLEEQLRQSQKMESIGTLAGGIAHDFNNILGAIIGFGEIIEMFDARGDSDIEENIGELLKAAYRAKTLVEQILIFSRQGEQEMQPLLLVPTLKEVTKFLRATLPATIDIQQNIAALPGTVLADVSQLHQVAMNLCTNAVQAMGAKGGILGISLDTEFLGADTSARFPDLKPGAYAKLSISDTGDGIPPEIQSRLFEPYFTTKGTGDGTGLGLAVAHGIVQQHAGAISVDSWPGQGATFHVLLPLIVTKPEKRPLDRNVPDTPGKYRVLLVDDEELLVQVGGKALSRLGYDVDTTTDGLAGLARFMQDPDRYDLVISDQTMPGITGLELAQKIKAVREDIPFILCTGFNNVATPERLAEVGIDELLPKPVGIRSLMRVVARLLEPSQ